VVRWWSRGMLCVIVLDFEAVSGCGVGCGTAGGRSGGAGGGGGWEGGGFLFVCGALGDRGCEDGFLVVGVFLVGGLVVVWWVGGWLWRGATVFFWVVFCLLWGVLGGGMMRWWLVMCGG